MNASCLIDHPTAHLDRYTYGEAPQPRREAVVILPKLLMLEAPAEMRSDVSDALVDAPNGPPGDVSSSPSSSTPVRVDVEFAHMCATPCEDLLTEAEVACSVEVAAGLVEHLRHHESVQLVTSVLIDDKKNLSDDIDERRKAAIVRCVDDLRADQVMLESELVHHLPDFAASLPPHITIANGFYGRLRRSGELACSQDVTIWHALRLGLFEPADARWAWNSASPDARPADVCVVILPRRFQPFEEKAYSENLGAFLGNPILGDQRMTLTGQFGGRQVTLWAIWIDVDTDSRKSDLRRMRELGRKEAVKLASTLTLIPC